MKSSWLQAMRRVEPAVGEHAAGCSDDRCCRRVAASPLLQRMSTHWSTGRLSGWQAGCVGSRVLVVEDDASVREAVALVLEASGFEVTVVGDGHSAIGEASRSGVH